MNIKGFKTKDGDSIVQTGDMVDERIGDLAELTTEEKTSVVGAINEVAASGGGSEIFTANVVDMEKGPNLVHNGEPVNYQELLGMIEAGKPRIITIKYTIDEEFIYMQVTNIVAVDAEDGKEMFGVIVLGEVANLIYQYIPIIEDENGNAVIDADHIVQRKIIFDV